MIYNGKNKSGSDLLEAALKLSINPCFFEVGGEKKNYNLIKRLKFHCFPGYTGQRYIVILDPESKLPFIVHPDIADFLIWYLPVLMPVVRDQHGNEGILFIHDPDPDASCVFGETKKQWLKRGQKEWIRIPEEHLNPIPQKISLPDPIPPSLPYEGFVYLNFEDRLINDLAHPVLEAIRNYIEMD